MAQPGTEFVLKRIYEPAADEDGYRVLVDRLWPRGISKQRARLDEWAKELAPSTELRRWFGHLPERFEEFTRRYTAELRANPDLSARVADWRTQPRVTLLYGAKDERHNEAVVLLDLLAG
ncbi:MAG: DUF488 family protein [Micropruina sp.]|nr:DUF488 family protein [Micropruina sp.]